MLDGGVYGVRVLFEVGMLGDKGMEASFHGVVRDDCFILYAKECVCVFFLNYINIYYVAN